MSTHGSQAVLRCNKETGTLPHHASDVRGLDYDPAAFAPTMPVTPVRRLRVPFYSTPRQRNLSLFPTTGFSNVYLASNLSAAHDLQRLASLNVNVQTDQFSPGSTATVTAKARIARH
jgi:hypothetical protein